MPDFGELSAWPEYARIFLGLFALVPPPIIIPLFLGVMARRGAPDMLAAARVGAIAFLATTTLFAFFGDFVLGVFGIGLPAFRMAGGFLLLMIALDMIRAAPDKAAPDAYRDGSAVALGIVPVAIPILAGPGTISAVVLFAAEHEGVTHKILMTLVLIAVSAVTYLVLRFAALSNRLFTPGMTLVFNKVMGLIVCAIAFEFIMNGIAAYLSL
jgi:multiple antibiotic resistance protein